MNIEYERARAQRIADHIADRARFDADRARHAARIRKINFFTLVALGTAAFFHFLHFIKWMLS